jgi:hypothetical protein
MMYRVFSNAEGELGSESPEEKSGERRDERDGSVSRVDVPLIWRRPSNVRGIEREIRSLV